MSYWISLAKRALYVSKSNLNYSVNEASINSKKLTESSLNTVKVLSSSNNKNTVFFAKVETNKFFYFGKLKNRFKKINETEAIYIDGSGIHVSHPFCLDTPVQIIQKKYKLSIVDIASELVDNSIDYDFEIDDSDFKIEELEDLHKIIEDLERLRNSIK